MGETASYASGNWFVKGGSEEEFVARWTEFLEWTRESASGLEEANLIRSTGELRRFVSFARWDDEESQVAWRALPEFPHKLGACRELCEEFDGGSFTQVVSV